MGYVNPRDAHLANETHPGVLIPGNQFQQLPVAVTNHLSE